MKKYLTLLIIATFVLVSCKSHRLLYSIKNAESFIMEDSVIIKMIDARAISLHGEYIIGVAIEITNKKENSIIVGENPILILESDSIVQQFKKEQVEFPSRRIDSTYVLRTGEKESFEICCYEVREYLPASVLRNYWLTKKENHNLILHLDIKDLNQNKIEKRIVLKPVK